MAEGRLKVLNRDLVVVALPKPIPFLGHILSLPIDGLAVLNSDLILPRSEVAVL